LRRRRPCAAHGDVTPQAVDTSGLKAARRRLAGGQSHRDNADAIRIGDSAFNQNCARCHGSAPSRAALPDLRKLDIEPETDEYFIGACAPASRATGRVHAAFEGTLSQEAMWAIRPGWRPSVKNDRRHFLFAATALLAGAMLPRMRSPSSNCSSPERARRGLCELRAVLGAWQGDRYRARPGARAALGQRAEFVEFTADENMSDDLRNMVWRGHYLGTRPADVMMLVPVDAHFAAENDKVEIFAPYHLETIAVARDPARVPRIAGSAANAFECSRARKIGAEVDTHASDYLLQVLNGRLRDNVVVHFPTSPTRSPRSRARRSPR